jgi:hypothetical protein
MKVVEEMIDCCRRTSLEMEKGRPVVLLILMAMLLRMAWLSRLSHSNVLFSAHCSAQQALERLG